MVEKRRQAFVPEQRSRTIRQDILENLTIREQTAKDLSKSVRKSEKEVYDHLEHLKNAGDIRVIPAKCSDCDYVFEERTKAKKPTKCPRCKSTAIEPPKFFAAA